jgi:Copper amine oxidase N-terminal domain/WXXGXW repeat (2 copies)
VAQIRIIFVVSYSFIPRILALAGTVLALALGAPASAQEVGITINGNPVDVSPAPINQAGRVFVPLRGVFENLGASVVYDNGLINATGDGHEISLHIGSTQATVDGNAETIDVAPFIIGASTYVPLRFVSQALGATVDYDPTNRVVAISTSYAAPSEAEAPAPSLPSYAYYANEAPPSLPDYEPPPVPAPDEIWQPGYWAFGPGGYYWVPGTWVPAPMPNLYWTPPFWAFVNGIFGFQQGYWGPQVGYYGGINYGGGYYGNGYGGGRWESGAFRYNTAVTRVENPAVITNVYVDKTVINNVTVNHVSYNGGPSGIRATPTPTQVRYEHEPHVPLTPLQVQHQDVASQDRRFLATVNGGKPPIVVAPKPFTTEEKPADFTPITEDDKAAGARLAAPRPTTQPVVHTAPPVEHIAPPVEHIAPPVVHSAPPVEHTAPPVEHIAPPVEHIAPPVVHTAPPVVHTAPPVYHTAYPQFVRPTPLHIAPPATQRPFVRTQPPTLQHTVPLVKHTPPPARRPAGHSTPKPEPPDR